MWPQRAGPSMKTLSVSSSSRAGAAVTTSSSASISKSGVYSRTAFFSHCHNSCHGMWSTTPVTNERTRPARSFSTTVSVAGPEARPGDSFIEVEDADLIERNGTFFSVRQDKATTVESASSSAFASTKTSASRDRTRSSSSRPPRPYFGQIQDDGESLGESLWESTSSSDSRLPFRVTFGDAENGPLHASSSSSSSPISSLLDPDGDDMEEASLCFEERAPLQDRSTEQTLQHVLHQMGAATSAKHSAAEKVSTKVYLLQELSVALQNSKRRRAGASSSSPQAGVLSSSHSEAGEPSSGHYARVQLDRRFRKLRGEVTNSVHQMSPAQLVSTATSFNRLNYKSSAAWNIIARSVERCVFGKSHQRPAKGQPLPKVQTSALSHSQICLVLYCMAKTNARVKEKFFYRMFRHMQRSACAWNEYDLCWILFLLRRKRLKCVDRRKSFDFMWARVLRLVCQVYQAKMHLMAPQSMIIFLHEMAKFGFYPRQVMLPTLNRLDKLMLKRRRGIRAGSGNPGYNIARVAPGGLRGLNTTGGTLSKRHLRKQRKLASAKAARELASSRKHGRHETETTRNLDDRAARHDGDSSVPGSASLGLRDGARPPSEDNSVLLHAPAAIANLGGAPKRTQTPPHAQLGRGCVTFRRWCRERLRQDQQRQAANSSPSTPSSEPPAARPRLPLCARQKRQGIPPPATEARLEAARLKAQRKRLNENWKATHWVTDRHIASLAVALAKLEHHHASMLQTLAVLCIKSEAQLGDQAFALIMYSFAKLRVRHVYLMRFAVDRVQRCLPPPPNSTPPTSEMSGIDADSTTPAFRPKLSDRAVILLAYAFGRLGIRGGADVWDRMANAVLNRLDHHSPLHLSIFVNSCARVGVLPLQKACGGVVQLSSGSGGFPRDRAIRIAKPNDAAQQPEDHDDTTFIPASGAEPGRGTSIASGMAASHSQSPKRKRRRRIPFHHTQSGALRHFVRNRILGRCHGDEGFVYNSSGAEGDAHRINHGMKKTLSSTSVFYEKLVEHLCKNSLLPGFTSKQLVNLVDGIALGGGAEFSSATWDHGRRVKHNFLQDAFLEYIKQTSDEKIARAKPSSQLARLLFSLTLEHGNLMRGMPRAVLVLLEKYGGSVCQLRNTGMLLEEGGEVDDEAEAGLSSSSRYEDAAALSSGEVDEQDEASHSRSHFKHASSQSQNCDSPRKIPLRLTDKAKAGSHGSALSEEEAALMASAKKKQRETRLRQLAGQQKTRERLHTLLEAAGFQDIVPEVRKGPFMFDFEASISTSTASSVRRVVCVDLLAESSYCPLSGEELGFIAFKRRLLRKIKCSYVAVPRRRLLLHHGSDGEQEDGDASLNKHNRVEGGGAGRAGEAQSPCQMNQNKNHQARTSWLRSLVLREVGLEGASNRYS